MLTGETRRDRRDPQQNGYTKSEHLLASCPPGAESPDVCVQVLADSQRSSSEFRYDNVPENAPPVSLAFSSVWLGVSVEKDRPGFSLARGYFAPWNQIAAFAQPECALHRTKTRYRLPAFRLPLPRHFCYLLSRKNSRAASGLRAAQAIVSGSQPLRWNSFNDAVQGKSPSHQSKSHETPGYPGGSRPSRPIPPGGRLSGRAS